MSGTNLISLTGQYALRALIYMAQNAGKWPILGKEIAHRAEIPPKYLSAILSTLVRVGVLESTRGKNGGFRMVRPPEEIMLIDALESFEQLDRRRCPFGNQECTGRDPCVAHDRWKEVVTFLEEFLKNTSIQDVAIRAGKKPVKKGHSRGKTIVIG